MGNDSPKPARRPMIQPQQQLPNTHYYHPEQGHSTLPLSHPNQTTPPHAPDQEKIDYPPYVMMGAHYNQQLIAQQQHALGYPQRGALTSIPNSDYASQVQEYYRKLYAQMGVPYQPQAGQQQQPGWPYNQGYNQGYYPGYPTGLPRGMLPNGGVPIGDGSMVMYETADPYDDPLQQPHWHRRNRPESGYAVNIVKMNPGGTMQERPNQF